MPGFDFEAFQKLSWSENLHLRDVASVARDASPFFYDVSARTLKGASIGFGISFIFFRSWRTRRLMTCYGMGFGFGSSFS